MKTTNTTLLDALKTINTVTEDYSVTIYVEEGYRHYDLTDQRDMWFCVRIIETADQQEISIAEAAEQYMNYVEIEGCAHRCTQCAHCYKGKCMMYKHNNQTWDEYLKDIEPKTALSKEIIKLANSVEGEQDDKLLVTDLIALAEKEGA